MVYELQRTDSNFSPHSCVCLISKAGTKEGSLLPLQSLRWRRFIGCFCNLKLRSFFFPPFLSPITVFSLAASLQGLWGNFVALWFDFLLVNELKCGSIYPLFKANTAHRKWLQRLRLRFPSLLSSHLLCQCAPKACGNEIFQKAPVKVRGSLWAFFLLEKILVFLCHGYITMFRVHLECFASIVKRDNTDV